MSSTAALEDVREMDVRSTLLAAGAERRGADRCEANLLVLAVHTVHLYPVDADTPTVSWADPSLTICDDVEDEPLAGAGTPLVAQRAVEDLAAALGISYGSCRYLVAGSLELRYRLPRLWALVQQGRLQAWKAREVADHSRDLGPEAVAFLDAQAAIAGARNRRIPNIAGLVHEALLRYEPDKAKEREDAARKRREVRVDYQPDSLDGIAGNATLTAHLDAEDARHLDTAISETARQLARLGDDSPFDELRARSLGGESAS
jgi:hypothetical protein